MSEKTIIVRNASEKSWPWYWNFDPTKTAIFPAYSCHTTEVGVLFGIKPYYDNREEALRDCRKLNQQIPSGNFAVCPMKEVSVLEPA